MHGQLGPSGLNPKPIRRWRVGDMGAGGWMPTLLSLYRAPYACHGEFVAATVPRDFSRYNVPPARASCAAWPQ